MQGRDHEYLLKSAPLRESGGRALGTLVVLHDVSLRRERSRAHDTAVAAVAQQLNTPLTSLSLAAGLLQRGREEQNELIREIIEDVDRLNHASADFLKVVREQPGSIALQNVNFDLRTVFDFVCRKFEDRIERRKIQFAVHAEKILGVSGDPLKLCWVIATLVGNALRYTPEMGKIDLTAEKEDEQIRISVWDSGPGIPPQTLRTDLRNRIQADDAIYQSSRAESASRSRRKSSRRTAADCSRKRLKRGGRVTLTLPLSQGILMPKLLIVDDEKNIRQTLARFLESCNYQVATADSGRQALELMSKCGDFDLVLSDWRMAEMNGLELLKTIKAKFPGTIVILMTAYGTIDNAVAAMKAGAYDYFTKPFSLDQVQHAVERALEVKDLRSQNRALRNSIDGVPLLASASPRFRELIEVAFTAAGSEASILLTGESGTGKNVLARQIHEWSPRHDHPFVTVNCTTLSEHLLESELFGHMKGSFTGAIKDKPGRLEAANQGTLFLDELAELSLSLQTKFLRFLQDGCFERIGGQETISVDTRVIAATNRDLQQEIAGGRFRADLYYRLNVISLRVPALREHPEDILPLAEKLLSEAAARNRRPDLRFSDEAKKALIPYSWPGNIRELRNVVERAVVLSRGTVIRKEDLSDVLFAPSTQRPIQLSADSSLEELEEEHIKRVLAVAPTLEDAAATLGISIPTLWRKRKRYHIE